MTNQELFDKVWDTFVTQRLPRSSDFEDNGCLYVSPTVHDHGCAIGCVLSPAAKQWVLRHDHNDESFGKLRDYYATRPDTPADVRKEITGIPLELGTALQSWHDAMWTDADGKRRQFVTPTMISRLKLIADSFELEVPNEPRH